MVDLEKEFAIVEEEPWKATGSMFCPKCETLIYSSGAGLDPEKHQKTPSCISNTLQHKLYSEGLVCIVAKKILELMELSGVKIRFEPTGVNRTVNAVIKLLPLPWGPRWAYEFCTLICNNATSPKDVVAYFRELDLFTEETYSVLAGAYKLSGMKGVQHAIETLY